MTQQMPQAASDQPARGDRKFKYVALILALLALLAALIFIRGVSQYIGDQPDTNQKSNAQTNGGSTSETGAPTQDTDTPADRTVPDPSGGEANTILNPE